MLFSTGSDLWYRNQTLETHHSVQRSNIFLSAGGVKVKSKLQITPSESILCLNKKQSYVQTETAHQTMALNRPLCSWLTVSVQHTAHVKLMINQHWMFVCNSRKRWPCCHPVLTDPDWSSAQREANVCWLNFNSYLVSVQQSPSLC